MESSLEKTVWKTFSKFFGAVLQLFLFFDLATLVFIFNKERLDWNQFFAVFTVIICLFSLTSVVTHLPLWIQSIYFPCFLLFYYKYGYQIFYSFPAGINYNFVWSLPKVINNLFSFSTQWKVIDFIFWSGFTFVFLIFVLQLQHWILGFLARKKVNFASEIWEEEKVKLEAELMEKKRNYLETQAKVKLISPKQKMLKAIFYIFLMFFLSGLIILVMSLFQKWENSKHPILWKKTFPGTAVCYWNSCGKKDSLLPQSIEPGKPRIETFSLEKENKELTIEVRISIQPIAKPKASLEIELKNPDGKRVFYLSKEKIFEGKTSGSPIKNSAFSTKFNFTADKQGKYTLRVTPYNYGIAYIDTIVRDIVK